MNEKLDLLRRQLWHVEKDVNKRKVIKGTRWLLLRNGNDIFDYAHRNRLEKCPKPKPSADDCLLSQRRS